MTDSHVRRLTDALVGAALAAANPTHAVARQLRLDPPAQQAVNDVRLLVGDQPYPLAAVDRLLVVGAGKAGIGMAAAVEACLGDRITGGQVNVPHGYGSLCSLERIDVHPAGHPLPDQASRSGTHQILDLLDGLTDRDLVIVLLSGGASALLEAPVPEVALADVAQLTGLLLGCGAGVREINAVRKHLSQVKGGGLARLITRGGARAIVMVLSDVVGNPLDAIGSGPCAPDNTSFADAWAILQRYRVMERVPQSVCRYLERGLRGEVAETVKRGDPLLQLVQHVVVADNRMAASAAAEQAKALGFHTLLLTTFLEGEARHAGQLLASLAKEVLCYGQPVPRPACLILGGETTVTVRGAGKGGRNQELALGAAMALADREGVVVVALATDGIDGPTDAAGALATGTTVARALNLGIDPHDHLARNDAYALFAALGDLIRTGPTGTNVNDLALVLVL